MWLALWLGLSTAIAGDLGELEGTWVYSGGATERSAVTQAIETVAGRFNVLVRGIVRSRLSKPMAIDEQITIKGTPEDARFEFEGPNPRGWDKVLDGVERIEHDNVRTRSTLSDGTITLWGESDEGGKKSRYQLLSPTQLKVEYEMWSPQLGEPIRWSLTYTRKSK